MAPRKAVKTKTPRKKQVRTVNAGLLEMLKGGRRWVVDYVAGIPSAPHTDCFISDEMMADLCAVPTYPTTWLLDMLAWLMPPPNPPLHTQAKALLAAAGPGPYTCKHCGVQYPFFHPTCRAELLGVAVAAGAKYVFAFEDRICDEELDYIARDLRALGVPGIIVDRPCHIYKLDR